MDSDMEWEALRARLRAHGQEHLLQHLDNLSPDEKQVLYREVSEVDLPRLSSLWDQASATLSQQGSLIKDEKLKPLDNSIVGSTAKDKGQLALWRDKGARCSQCC